MKNLKKSLCLLVLFTLTVSCSGGNSSSKKTDANENETSADVTLSSLEISSATLDGLSPEFDSSVTEYEVQQNFLSDNFFSFTATTTDSEASLIVNEELATSGEETSIALDSSDYTASLYVVAPDASASQEYTVNVTRNPLAQTAYVKANNTDVNDTFGQSVAISGDLMVVGAPYEDGLDDGTQDNSGSAYVYTRNDTGSWKFSTKLKASNPDIDDAFGKSVAIDGDTIVVGAYYESGSATTVNGTADNLKAKSGAAYVFERSTSDSWSQTAYLKGSHAATNDLFGEAVAIDNNTIIVGVTMDDTSAINAGGAYVFVRSGNTWQEQAFLQASTGESNDRFGGSVAINQDTIVIGATDESGSAIEVNGFDDNDSVDYYAAGAAYIFERTGTNWEETAYLKSSNTDDQLYFGNAVGVSENTVVVGCRFDNSDTNNINGDQYNQSAPSSGAVYVYVRNGDYWVFDSYLKAPNSDTNDLFGLSVAIDGDHIIVGAPGEASNAQEINGNQNNNASLGFGASYIFRRNSSSDAWEFLSYLKAGNADSLDNFGMSVDIDGDTAIVGAPFEDGSGTKVNPAADNDLTDTGAAYLFQ